MKSKPVQRQKPTVMKTVSGSFLSRLMAAMPISAFRKPRGEKRAAFSAKNMLPGREETLNRIFIVRYRVQHL